jgi:hypothetical protein
MGEIENFKSREGTGPKALNRIVKAMLGSQAGRKLPWEMAAGRLRRQRKLLA